MNIYVSVTLLPARDYEMQSKGQNKLVNGPQHCSTLNQDGSAAAKYITMLYLLTEPQLVIPPRTETIPYHSLAGKW